MFRVAVITNENEVSHSSFADTVSILRRPVSLGTQKTDTYIFTEFDKFTVSRLFQDGHQDNLLKFDSLVVATNATNNVEVLSALRNGRTVLEEFIESGKGILVLSQKKLSSASHSELQNTGFLPVRFDYALCDRPEQSSAAGKITIAEANDRIVKYPSPITEEIIEKRCAQNSFMEHRYRSILVPSNPNLFIAILVDRESQETPRELQMGLPPGRPVLIRAASSRERVVATSMALDWAGHEELLENLLVYITEGQDQIAVLRRRETSLDDPIDVYASRARAAKLPIREYYDIDVENAKLPSHRAIIVSPAYSEIEVAKLWDSFSRSSPSSFDLYHLSPASREREFQMQRRSFSNSANNLALSSALWISRSFIPSLWGKSIWTYNYVLPTLKELEIDISPFSTHVLDDIAKHVRLSESGASYDNVPNATAQLLELLCGCFTSLSNDAGSLRPHDLVKKCETWIIKALGQKTNVSARDRMYMLNSLSRSDRITAMQAKPLKEIQLIALGTLQGYKEKDLDVVETVELTQCLELALTVKIIAERLAPKDSIAESDDEIIHRILVELKRRQRIEGSWKNVSVSGDVLIALLRVGTVNSRIAESAIVKEMLVKGVEYLIRSFDNRGGNWSNDVNATAKAARALVMFDRHRGLSSADFVEDIHGRTQILQHSEFCSESLKHDGALLKVLLASEVALKAANENLDSARKQVARISTREKVLRITAFGFLVIALTTSASLGLIAWILSTKHPQVLTGVLGNWSEYLVSGFVSILLTLVFMGMYTYAKTRLIK